MRQFPSSQDWLWTTNSCCKFPQCNSEYRPPLFLCTVRAQVVIDFQNCGKPTSFKPAFSSLSFLTCWIFCFWFWWPSSRAYWSPSFCACEWGVGTQEMGHIPFSKRPAIQCGYCLTKLSLHTKLHALDFDYSFTSQTGHSLPASFPDPV